MQHPFKIKLLNKKERHPLDWVSHYLGETQIDALGGTTYHSHTHKKIIWVDMFTPKEKSSPDLYDNLPEYLKIKNKQPKFLSNTRNILWQNISQRETRADGQFARLFELIVPHQLNTQEAANLMTRFCEDLVAQGMIVDASIHSTNNKKTIEKNFLSEKATDTDAKPGSLKTGYALATLRTYKNGVFENKERKWNSISSLIQWKANWEKYSLEAVANCCANQDKPPSKKSPKP